MVNVQRDKIQILIKKSFICYKLQMLYINDVTCENVFFLSKVIDVVGKNSTNPILLLFTLEPCVCNVWCVCLFAPQEASSGHKGGCGT